MLCPLLVLALLGLAAPAAANPPRSSAALEADRAIDAASLAGRRLLILLDRTRLAGDRRRTSCVDSKLSEVNSFRRMLEERRLRLLAAESRGDAGGATHERRVVRTLSEQLRRLEVQGRRCVSPEAGQRDETEVIVTVAPDVPDEDPSRFTEADRQRRW
jgi:hypothetical protein